MYLEVFVQQATIVQRAAVCPHPAQLALTKMRLEEKAKMTANHALLVNKKLCPVNVTKLTFICTVQIHSRPWMSLPGWFQDLSGQRECNPCPPGFHCQSLSSSPTRGSSNGVSSPLPCPAGYICPRESSDSPPLPCPRGTYNPSQGLTTTGKNPEHLQKKREQVELSCTIVWLFSCLNIIWRPMIGLQSTTA